MNFDIQGLTKAIGDFIETVGFSYQTTIKRAIRRFLATQPEYYLDDEWAYASFSQKDRGRPFQADLLIRHRGTGRVVCVIEIKNLYEQSVNIRQYLYDLVRLESAKFDQPVERLLIVAGERKFERFLLGGTRRTSRPSNADILHSLLPFSLGAPKSVDLKRVHPKLAGATDAFARDLGIVVPNRLKTELISDYTTPRARVNVWRVAEKSSRRTAAVVA